MTPSGHFVAALVIGSTLVVAAPASAAVNLIDAAYGAGAGSFELGVFTPRGSGSANFQSLAGGAANIAGWTVGGVGVDWLSTPDYGAQHGAHAVDLGYYVGGAGSIATSIATVKGASYSLTFTAAAVPGFPTYTNGGQVSAGSLAGQVFAPSFSAPNDFAHQVFVNYAFNFIAFGTTTSIAFSASDPRTSYGPVIDQVSVSLVSLPGSVPEPATWAMMILGFGAAGTVIRRRNALAG